MTQSLEAAGDLGIRLGVRVPVQADVFYPDDSVVHLQTAVLIRCSASNHLEDHHLLS